MPEYANTLETMLAKQDILDVLARYARGTDRADEALMRSCYHEDAIEEHANAYSGPAKDYIPDAVKRIRKMGVMAHYVCNSHIELDGDTAWVESYVLTFARFAKDGRNYDTFTGGRLCDRFEKRGGEWRIAHRKITFDWNRDVEASEGWCLGMFDLDDPRVVLGEKNENDLSYARF